MSNFSISALSPDELPASARVNRTSKYDEIYQAVLDLDPEDETIVSVKVPKSNAISISSGARRKFDGENGAPMVYAGMRSTGETDEEGNDLFLVLLSRVDWREND